MRLICGVFHLDGQAASAQVLDAMCAQMIEPGLRPRIRVWRDGAVALAVLDFSARADAAMDLPQKDDWTVAADLRFDAPKALAQSLNIDPAPDRDNLLLAALQRWGADAPPQILGDFAFAAWNRATRTLVCARDPLGIRPLVYVHVPARLFAFASLPRALHGSGLIERKLNRMTLARHAVGLWEQTDTLFENIYCLAPAHTLEVGAEGLSSRRYWQLDLSKAGSNRIAPDEAARQLRTLVEEAVRCRLPAEGPVAAHLSGGLDSSAITILAARMLRAQGRTLLAYSFLPRPTDNIDSDAPFVEAVFAQEPDIVRKPIHAVEFRHQPQRMDCDHIWSIEPHDPDTAVCIDAAASGAGIVLCGTGGDEGVTFNGQGGLAEALLRGRWRYLAAEIAALGRTRGWAPGKIWRDEILAGMIPAWAMTLQRRLRRRPKPYHQVRRLILKRNISAQLGNTIPPALTLGADARVNQFILLSSGFVARRAGQLALIGARYGLGFAFPLLDRRIVEFVLSLPSALFLRDGFKRRVFRDAMASVLPETIRWRHDKLPPMPDAEAAFAASAAAVANYLAARRTDPHAAELFDFDYLLATLEAFPTAEAVRAGTGNKGPLLTVATAVGAISYLESNY